MGAIEGIGPAIEQRFRQVAVFTVYDPLRASASRLGTVVSALASFDAVRSWRQMATLLEAEAVTPQWAEALVKSGIASRSDLRRPGHSELVARSRTPERSG